MRGHFWIFLALLSAACACESKDDSDSQTQNSAERLLNFLTPDAIVELLRAAAKAGKGQNDEEPDPAWAKEWARYEQRLDTWDQLKDGTREAKSLALTQGDLGSIDLRDFDTEVKDQGKEGLCTAYAVIAAIENMARYQNVELDLSELALWNTYRQYNLRTAVVAALRSDISIFDPVTDGARTGDDHAKPPHEIAARITSAREINVEDVYAALAAHQVVIFATETTKPFFDRRGIVNPYNPASGLGHAMAAVGMIEDSRVDGGGYLILKNSWGSDAGDYGYIYLPLAHCSLHECRFYKVESIQVITR